MVVMFDGVVLNCYWDVSDMLCDELYLEDVMIVKLVLFCLVNEVYCDLCVGVESGWDYSLWWFGDGKMFVMICMMLIVLVDLNSLMFYFEMMIVKGCVVMCDIVCVVDFLVCVGKCVVVINYYLWNCCGYYGDYDW